MLMHFPKNADIETINEKVCHFVNYAYLCSCRGLNVGIMSVRVGHR